MIAAYATSYWRGIHGDHAELAHVRHNRKTRKMKIQFDMPDTFVASIRKKAGLDVELAKLPAHALRVVFEYGLQRIHNDACGAAGTVDKHRNEAEWVAACVDLATKKRDALYAGTISTRGATRTAADPVEHEMAKRLAADVRASFRAEGVKAKDVTDEMFESRYAEWHESYFEDYRDEAEALIEREASNAARIAKRLTR